MNQMIKSIAKWVGRLIILWVN